MPDHQDSPEPSGPAVPATDGPASGDADPLAAALNTKVEDEFIAPLTAIRSKLEILRDFPDLMTYDRKTFIESALTECDRLKAGIDHLAGVVYSAGRGATEAAGDHEDRIHIMADQSIIDLDFSGLEFSSADQVNAFYDALDRIVLPSGHKWYFMANHTGCRVWPEAWVAFAHRGKRVAVSFAFGVVKYLDGADPAAGQDMAPSREAALAMIAGMKGGQS